MKSVRELHGKTLDNVAGRIGISIAMLSMVERELAPVNEKALKRWLRLFYMEEAELRRGSISWSSFLPSQNDSGSIVKSG